MTIEINLLAFIGISFWLAGAVVMYVWANGKLRERTSTPSKDKNAPRQATDGSEKDTKSGMVKAIRPEEIQEEKDKGFINQMKNIIDDDEKSS